MEYATQTVIFVGITILCTSSETKVESESSTPKLFCCARHERRINAGYGISGNMIKIDAGQCRPICPHNVHDDPGDLSKPAVQKCPAASRCRPRFSRMERVSTLQGVRVIERVDSCDCANESSCQRVPFEQLIHSGSPHQISVDIGLCVGQCSDGLNCQLVENKTISIRGPNGDEVYQVVNKCRCARSCHRMDQTESVLDYSRPIGSKRTNSTDIKPLIKKINVGYCTGNCLGNQTETCILRDKKDNSRCVAGLYLKQPSCSPARFKVHDYTTRSGHKREIIQIVDCACI